MNIVKAYRERAGLTQAKLAAITKLDRTTISKIESGNTTTVATAKRIALVLGFEWKCLFEDADANNL